MLTRSEEEIDRFVSCPAGIETRARGGRLDLQASVTEVSN